ncbi:hypothetical protein [Actinomadura yumaensis]|uniref:Uncharacterized protein n=1 Tax=Actinomadura yumaensis TaxID=111807 RepID=A0ABW2CMF4_9ACTN
MGEAGTRPPFGTLTGPYTGAIETPAEWFAVTHRGCQVVAFSCEQKPGPFSSKGWTCLVQVRTPWVPETRVLPYTQQIQQVYEQFVRPDMPMFVPDRAPNIMVYSADAQQAKAVLTAEFLKAIDHDRRPRPKITPPVSFNEGVLNRQSRGRLDPQKALDIADGLIDLLLLIPATAWPGAPQTWPPGPWLSR